MFTFYGMFTFLKGLEMFSNPAMHVRYSLLLGILTYFGVTVRYFVLKLYWVTSEIAYSVRTLEAKSSAPISLSLTYRKCGTCLYMSEHLTDRSGRLSPKVVPIFLCRPHCRKTGTFSVDVLVHFATMLKGDMWR